MAFHGRELRERLQLVVDWQREAAGDQTVEAACGYLTNHPPAGENSYVTEDALRELGFFRFAQILRDETFIRHLSRARSPYVARRLILTTFGNLLLARSGLVQHLYIGAAYEVYLRWGRWKRPLMLFVGLTTLVGAIARFVSNFDTLSALVAGAAVAAFAVLLHLLVGGTS